MTDWYPPAIVNKSVKRGASFIAGVPARGVLHTTEGRSFSPKTDSYGGWHTAYPHFTLIEDSSGVLIYQHIPINVAARALKNLEGGVQTNRAHAIQIELVGMASQSANFSEQMLGAISTWMRWVEHETGVRPVAPLEFVGRAGGSGETARSRMSSNEWLAFNGWCGHQHVPENDHWDPGHINIGRLLATAATPTDLGTLASSSNQEEPTGSADVFRVINVSADDILNVRAEPGLDGAIVGRLAADAGGLGVSGERRMVGQSAWVTVTVSGTSEGWVNAHYLAPHDRKILFRVVDVEADEHLNVREGAGTDRSIVARLDPGSKDVRRTGRAAVVDDSVWWEIDDPQAGWVHSGYLRDQDARTAVRGGVEEEPEIDEIGHGDVEIGSVYDD